MSSQHQAGIQHTTTPHLDGYLKGIRDEFDRLNHELDETRKQRDQYITKYRKQVEELQELRQTVSRREEHTVCQPGQGEITHSACRDKDDSSLISPVSSTSEYHSSLEEEEDSSADRLNDSESAKEVGQFDGEREQDAGDGPDNEITVEPTITGVVSLSPESNSTFTNKLEYSAWDVEFISNTAATLNLNLVHKFTLMGGAVVTFSTDGKYLATASSSGIVSIFESKTGKRISVMKDLYHDEKSLPAYTCLEFSPDSKFLATGETDGNARIWIISQRRVRNTFGHQRIVTALNFSPDGRCLVTCSYDRTVRIWGLRDGSSKVLTTFRDSLWSVRCSPNGRHIASGGYPQNILIWTMRTGKLVTTWPGHSGCVASLVFTPDGKGLLSASWDMHIIHWDVASLGMADPPSSDPMEICRLLGHKDTIDTVSISPDGKWIASGSRDKTVRIWNAYEATLHCILHCPGEVWSVDFSPFGNCLAIGGVFDDVTIWNYSVNP